MRTRLDIKTKLQPMLYAVGTSTYFTSTRIDSAINDCYLAVASAKQWPDIKKGFVTSTKANENYYDYPDNCQTESIFKIMVDGDSKYDKWDFEDFLREIEDHPSSNKKMFSEYGRQIFLYPTPLADGAGNLIFWGLIQASSLAIDTDITMFTDWADILNEAVLQYAYADLIQNIDVNKATLARTAGEKIINSEYQKIANRLQRKLSNKPQWDVPDYFAHTASGTGNFTR